MTAPSLEGKLVRHRTRRSLGLPPRPDVGGDDICPAEPIGRHFKIFARDVENETQGAVFQCEKEQADTYHHILGGSVQIDDFIVDVTGSFIRFRVDGCSPLQILASAMGVSPLLLVARLPRPRG